MTQSRFSVVRLGFLFGISLLVSLPLGRPAQARHTHAHGRGLDSRCVPSFGEQKLVGMRCTEIKPSSILHKAGVVNGDIVLSLDGKPTLSPRDMMAALRTLKEADQAELKVLRDGKERTLNYAK